MTSGTVAVVWLETQGSILEETHHQGQGQESRHFDLFQCLLQSPFLSHRDGNGSWSSGVRVPLGLEAVKGVKSSQVLLQSLWHLGCCLSHDWAASISLRVCGRPCPSSFQLPLSLPDPYTRSSKLYRSLDQEWQAIGLVGAEEGSPLSLLVLDER